MDFTCNKAIVAALVTGLSTALTLAATLAGDGLSTEDWFKIAASFIGPSGLSAYFTYIVSNRADPDPRTSTPDDFAAGELVREPTVYAGTPPPIRRRQS